jgi:hypothetical protein
MKERSRPPSIAVLLMVATLAGQSVSPATAADEPDLIFKRSTVFKWLTPDDKLVTYGIDDPEVVGVACHFTVPEKGGLKGRCDKPAAKNVLVIGNVANVGKGTEHECSASIFPFGHTDCSGGIG